MIKTQAEIVAKELLRTDGGKEFDNHDVSNFADTLGLRHSMTAPCTPKKNLVAERENPKAFMG